MLTCQPTTKTQPFHFLNLRFYTLFLFYKKNLFKKKYIRQYAAICSYLPLPHKKLIEIPSIYKHFPQYL